MSVCGISQVQKQAQELVIFSQMRDVYMLIMQRIPPNIKTLFNIVEAPFKKKLNFDVCVVWWCSTGPINSQEYNSFEIYTVSFKISMTEYHHWINGLVDHVF